MNYPTNNEDTRVDGESVSIDPFTGEFDTYLTTTIVKYVETISGSGSEAIC